jgi:hypothetical protein
MDAEVRFGVRRMTDPFQAHAWVEHRGTVLNDTLDVRERFAVFEPIEVPSADTRNPVTGGSR